VRVSLFGRRKGKGSSEGEAPAERASGSTRKETMAHLADFVATRVGVEAYIEPPNSQIQTTLLLIATTGEWTRRKVPDAKTAREIAGQLGIPVYDVNFTGYPQRMRDWNAAQRKGR
jgi:hypothetical protein